MFLKLKMHHNPFSAGALGSLRCSPDPFRSFVVPEILFKENVLQPPSYQPTHAISTTCRIIISQWRYSREDHFGQSLLGHREVLSGCQEVLLHHPTPPSHFTSKHKIATETLFSLSVQCMLLFSH